MPLLKPSRLAVFIKKSPAWKLCLQTDGLVVDFNESRVGQSYSAITDLAEDRGWIWSTLRLKTSEGDVFLRGMGKSECQQLIQEITSRIIGAVTEEITRLREPALRLSRHLDTFFSSAKYLAQYDLRNWLAAVQKLPQPEMARLRMLLAHPYLESRAIPADLAPAFRKLQDILAGPRQGIVEWNAAFVKKELIAHADFFDSVESRPLTDEQRKASVVMEDRNLLIAAAGSGKSSTVVAKIGYALKTNFCRPDEILAVMFNHNAREELETRLTKRLPEQGGQVATRTFHKLGLDIIAAVEGKKPTLAPWVDDAGAFIERLVEDLLVDPEFLGHWLLFRSVCFRPNRELSQFKDQRDYERYLREVGEERDGRRGILTLNGELVRSMEEVAIANWLFLNGVNYPRTKMGDIHKRVGLEIPRSRLRRTVEELVAAGKLQSEGVRNGTRYTVAG